MNDLLIIRKNRKMIEYMSIVLARIDDRLIHGQVTEGWGKVHVPERVLVVSDNVVSCDWECELCLAALPSNVKGKVVKVDDAAIAINELLADDLPSYVLFESPKDAYRAVRAGAAITKLNVGGMHSSHGKREVIDYIYVDETDEFYLKELKKAGVYLDFRDLPDRENVDVMALL